MQIEPYRLRLRQPIREIEERRGFVVLLREGDLIGRGEACILPGTESLEEAEAALRSGQLERAPAARHALGLAQLDLQAQRKGVPLARLLDPRAPLEVPCSALLVSRTVPELAREAGRAVADGFRTVKLKVGGDDDFALAAVVRDAVGPDVALRLDANGAWDAPLALERLAELAPLDIELCEQPTPDLLGLESSPIPIAADEMVARDPAAAMERAQIIVLKPMLLGGVLAAWEIAQRAMQRGLRVIVTTALDGAIARAAAAHLAAAVLARGPQPAAGLATGRLLVDDLCPDALAPRDGIVRIPDVPGLGLS
jgi:L-alanine-DL-glutamate epimerase-like enolase superfamily enzyme